MKLVIINAGHDTAGCGIGLKTAFDRHAPGWEARSVSRHISHIEYPTDIFWPRLEQGRIRRQVIGLVQAADVVHVMDQETALAMFTPWLDGKTIVMHHLGTRFRRDPDAVSTYCRRYGATEVTDSIDLIQPHVPFLPVPADLDAFAALRRATRRRSKRIRIAHAPTNRALKHTEEIIAAVESLADAYPIDFDLIEGVTHAECLARKARADIFVDQLLFGFGLNAIECFAMGIPVVSGLRDPQARRNAVELFGQVPWADATKQTLVAVIEHLITDAAWRKELGERGRAHVQQWHSQRSVVERTLAVYERAGARIAA